MSELWTPPPGTVAESQAPPLEIKFHPKQLEFFLTEATDVFFGGATRGGKSYASRMALIIWSSWIPGLQSFIFRKHYEDVLSNHMEGPDGFRAVLAQWVKLGLVKITENQVKWTRTGSLITLGHCGSDEAAEKAQGVAKHVLVLEEVTQLLERHIRWLRAWVSMSKEMQEALPPPLRGRFPRIIQTGNPVGASMGYYRRQFVKAAPKNTIFTAPKTEGGFKRIYIEARVEDNPSENADQVRGRVQGLNDSALADALLNSNWDAPVGDFFPQYDERRHVTPDFMPPPHWFTFATFDWGSSDPFCVLWWCVSDGESFKDYADRERWFHKGALIAYREWYGCDPHDQSKGLELRNTEMAKGIKKRTIEKFSGIILTDNKPFQDVGLGKNDAKYKIKDIFADCGVPLTLANTARVTGWTQVRDRLIGIDGFPLLLLTEGCKYTREYLPMIGRDPENREDAEKDGEATHCADCVRYAASSRPRTLELLKPQERKEFQVQDPSKVNTPMNLLKRLTKKESPYGRYSPRG